MLTLYSTDRDSQLS